MEDNTLIAYAFMFGLILVFCYILYLRTALRVSRERQIHLIDDLLQLRGFYQTSLDPSMLLKERRQIKNKLDYKITTGWQIKIHKRSS